MSGVLTKQHLDRIVGVSHHVSVGPVKGRTELRRRGVNKKNMVPLKEAADIFGMDVGTLGEITEANFGVMSVPEVSKLLGIPADTLYSAVGREGTPSKFPRAIVYRYDEKGLRLKGPRRVNILHRDFVEWKKGHRPHNTPRKICKLHEYAGKFYTDRAGTTYIVPDCTNELKRFDRIFCSTSHYAIFCQLQGIYAELGAAGTVGKGRVGPRRGRKRGPKPKPSLHPVIVQQLAPGENPPGRLPSWRE
jgi:hypothetical protein